jgi:hypothetical protein
MTHARRPLRAQCVLYGLLAAIAAVGSTTASSARNGDSESTTRSNAPAAVAAVISEDQLQGTWMDSEKADRFTSRWTFAKPNMTFVRYNGRVTQATYTLKGNTLIVHHAPGLLNKEPWDETMELKHYSGETLTWDYGTLVTLHRVP